MLLISALAAFIFAVSAWTLAREVRDGRTSLWMASLVFERARHPAAFWLYVVMRVLVSAWMLYLAVVFGWAAIVN